MKGLYSIIYNTNANNQHSMNGRSCTVYAVL